ncbi:TIR domain-containing protein (plasmid) [Streptomyces cynarae]|uniref:TIR domain-containing protein n=1 Tax=Streptomyces cynarae TaxID=2981134 RepID=A0ABY6EEI0_9ACTN|nr:TIR domain-containing protein [Streptomyces cynarae]UXY25075.1 TIR domain-containing protein [Streptomyces cynarae]
MTDSSDAAPHYDAFISYSHSWDNAVATAFQSELQSMARPWYRWRMLRTFRDVTNLTASPGLWPDIERALSQSQWLVVMASPAAAGSFWVRKEIRWWLTHRSPDTILIALTDGTLLWDEDAADFDWNRTNALPREELEGVFRHQPRWVDLSWLHTPEQANRADPRMIECAADFVAPIRGMSKDELIGEHVRQRRRTKRWVRGTLATLTVLLVLAASGGIIALQQRSTAIARQYQATSRQLIADAQNLQDTQPDLARQLLVEAYRLDPHGGVLGALLSSAAIPRVVSVGGLARGVAYSPHRNLIAIAGNSGVTLYDPGRLAVLAHLTGQHGYAQGLSLSDDDRMLAVGDQEGYIRLFDVTSPTRPRLLASAEAHGAIVDNTAFTPDSRHLAVGIDGGQVLIFDIGGPNTLRLAATFTGSPTTGLSDGLAISPDGRLLAAGGDNIVQLWDVSQPDRPTLREQVQGSGQTLAFSPDGHLLAVGGRDDTVRLWDVTQPKDARQDSIMNGQRLGISAVAFSHSGSTLGVGADDGTIQLWQVSDPLHPVPGSQLTGHSSGIAQLAFSRDDRTLASASTDGAALGTDGVSGQPGTVRLWNIDGASRSAAQWELSGGTGTVPAFDRTGATLAAGYPTRLWDTTGGAPTVLSTVPSFGQGGNAVAFSPNADTLAAGASVALWDVRDRAHPRPLVPGGQAVTGASSVVFAPAGSLLAVGADEVQLWDVRNRGKPVQLSKLNDSRSKGNDVAFRPDGKALASVDHAGKIQLWDIATPSRPVQRATIKAAHGNEDVVAFTSDGRTLLAGSSAGALTTWDVHDVAHPRQLASPISHVGSIGGLAYDPQAPLAASAGEDGNLLLWDMSDPSHPAVLASLQVGGAFDPALLAFSPNGEKLAAETATEVQVWDAQAPNILRRLCAQSPHITPDQWKQYLPQMTYDPPCAS